MKPRFPRRVLAARAMLAAVLIGAPATVAAQSPTALPEFEPALLAGPDTGLAYTAADPIGARVWAAFPAHRNPQALGPDTDGFDGAPRLARLSDGALLVASRRDRAGARVWAQIRHHGKWQPPVWLTGAGEHLHPTVATGGGRTWIVWASLGAGGTVELLAAELRGGTWSPTERLPLRRMSGGRPALAVGADGLPRVAWSAHDGTDAEIWLARRTTERWERPERLTRNRRHDLAPDLTFHGDRLFVAFESDGGGGYLPYVMPLRGDGHRPTTPIALDAHPGAAVRLADTAAGLTAVWSAPDPLSPRHSRLVASRRSADGWRPAETLGRALNARAGLAAADNEWLLGWHAETGVAAARVRPGDFASTLEPLVGLAQVADLPITLSLPGTYLALGDSITAGLVRFDGVISFVDGYSVHLGSMISEHIGSPVVVEQSAVPGEFSSEGYNRLRATFISNPRQYAFLNEGANDLANLVAGEVVRDNLVAMALTVLEQEGLPFVGTVTPRTEGSFTGGINDRIEYANELIRETLPTVSLVTDLWAAFIGRQELYSDHIHPNAGGYEVMAGVWFRTLLPVLNDLLRDDDERRAIDEDTLLRLQQSRRPDGPH